MSNNSKDDDFYGSLAAAAGEDSDSDAKAIQDMDDLEDDLFGNLLKKNRGGSNGPKTKPKLPAVKSDDILTEKPPRPRAGQRRASIIDDDDFLDDLLPSDKESPPLQKKAQMNTLPPNKPSVSPAETNPSASMTFGSYVPSVTSAAPKTPRQSALAEPDFLSGNGTRKGTPRRGNPSLLDDSQPVTKQDSRTSVTNQLLTSSKDRISDIDGLDRVPQRERRSSLKDTAELPSVGVGREQRNNVQDLDWLAGDATGNHREGTAGRRARSGELPWLDASPSQTSAPKTNSGLAKREAEGRRSDVMVPRTDITSHSEKVLVQTETGISRPSSSLPIQQLDRRNISATQTGTNHVPDVSYRDVTQQSREVVRSNPQEIKLLEEKIVTFASSLEGKMEKIEQECKHIQELVVKVTEAHVEQRKAFTEASRLESERLQNSELDLETRLKKIHLDWKKDLVSQDDEWNQKWNGSLRQLQSVQHEYKIQVEGLQSKVREDVSVIQSELQSFIGKLKPLQIHNNDHSDRRHGNDVVDELAKLNAKLDRLVSQFEVDRQLLKEYQRKTDDLHASQVHRSQPEHLVRQEEYTKAKEENMVQQIMGKIQELQEKTTLQLFDRIKHVEKTQEELSSSVSLLASDIHNTFNSTSNGIGLASLQALKVNEEQLLEWHSQLEEESQSIAAERIEMTKQKQAVHQLSLEIEQRFREMEENDASANKVKEAGLQALNQAKQLENSWQERMTALNDQLEALKRKELYLLQKKTPDNLSHQTTGAESCRRCREMFEASQETLQVPHNWPVEQDSLAVFSDIDFDAVGEPFLHSTQNREGAFDSKVVMWSVLAVQDRKLLREEESYLESLSLSRTMRQF